MVFDLSVSIQGPQSCPYAALLMRCDRGKSFYIHWLALGVDSESETAATSSSHQSGGVGERKTSRWRRDCVWSYVGSVLIYQITWVNRSQELNIDRWTADRCERDDQNLKGEWNYPTIEADVILWYWLPGQDQGKVDHGYFSQTQWNANRKVCLVEWRPICVETHAGFVKA